MELRSSARSLDASESLRDIRTHLELSHDNCLPIIGANNDGQVGACATRLTLYLTEEEAHAIGVDAYLYFHSPVTMDVRRKQLTNVEPGAAVAVGASARLRKRLNVRAVKVLFMATLLMPACVW